MLVKDRPRLTEQALRSLYANTDHDAFSLVIVDDGSDMETSEIIARYAIRKNCMLVSMTRSVGIVGFLRNIGAWTSERYFGRGEYLYFSDNDVYFREKWLIEMIGMMEGMPVSVLGGCRHPFHRANHSHPWGSWGTLEETDAVAGYSMLMRWGTFDEFGPFDQHSKGVCQSEDWAFCRKVYETGGRVGYTASPKLYHCGITNSEGKPCIGHEQIERVGQGVIYE